MEAVRSADSGHRDATVYPGCDSFPPNQAPILGRIAMRAWLETFPPIQQFTITADEIVGCEDLAFVRGTYAMTDARAPTRRRRWTGVTTSA